MPQRKQKRVAQQKSGRLRIGDNWNAITIIALSQNNPLKAIAEFVENSIDAKAKHISIIRGKVRGEHFLKIVDDGEGLPLDETGVPNFQYVATHICDSIKRRLKNEGVLGVQGEFGIGLLSFWTVGECLLLSCGAKDNKIYHMRMTRGEPGYQITHRQLLSFFPGTELLISPLLAGLRQLNGEKIQRYLASELRDRIRQTQIKVKVIDHFQRCEYPVEPRQFSGQLIHQLPSLTAPQGEIYTELYLNSPEQDNKIGLYRCGTRVLPSLTQLDEFQCAPWTSGYLQGIMDAPFLNLTPGTRDGIIRDEQFELFCQMVRPLQEKLLEVIAEQHRAQEERSSKEILKTVQMALKEAILSLPQEEYDWFEVHANKFSSSLNVKPEASMSTGSMDGDTLVIPTEEKFETEEIDPPAQKQFFEFSGPLQQIKISPGTCNISVNSKRNFRVICRYRKKLSVDQNLSFQWEILEGAGILNPADSSMVTFEAPAEPCLCRLGVKVRQNDIECQADAIITVTDSILPEHLMTSKTAKKGLPGYTLKSAPGELWRSRYDIDQNLVVINNAHRDFVYASKEKSRKLRYICRLFVKELILANFINGNSSELLERMIELSLYTEESLR